MTLSATNNGVKNAEYVEYYCLFPDRNGQVVDTDRGFLMDSDSVIKPGNTETCELKPYDLVYDSVDVYFKGRSTK